MQAERKEEQVHERDHVNLRGTVVNGRSDIRFETLILGRENDFLVEKIVRDLFFD